MSGLWKSAVNWEDAREFVIQTIEDSQGLSQSQRNELKELEILTYENWYKKSVSSGWYEGAVAYYSDEETRNDIAGYAAALFAQIEIGEYPEQFKKVFASFADTTYTVKTEGKEFIDNETTIPKWVYFLGAGVIWYLWKK